MRFALLHPAPGRRRATSSFGRLLAAGLCALGLFAGAALAEDKTYSFGVINQRSPVLTARYWNPILAYLGKQSGLALTLKLAKTAPEQAAMIGRGEFDFVYSNHTFLPQNTKAGYRVIARPREEAIRGEIVVLADSPVTSLQDLAGKEVVFPSAVAFVGYYVPMDALLHEGITVTPVFAGNQEGGIGQLVARRVAAAGVNSQVMRDFAQREGVKYRVLWHSEEYLNIPISAHPAVAKADVDKVRAALLGMADDPEGARILAAAAELIKQKPPYGFVAARDQEFDNVRRFYKKSLVQEP